MKIKASIKYVKSNFSKCFYAGYCDLWHIMKGEDPIYYNSGVYGWNCDVYCDFKRNIAITTGYRNMTGERIPSELIEKHTKIAKDIASRTWGARYEDINAELAANREEFFAALAAL